MHARRALLYVPGSDLHKIEKAAGLGADAVCVDLEDGVAANRKVEARRIAAQALSSLNFGRSERLARINDIGSGLEAEDLTALVPLQPAAILIPKAPDSDSVHWVDDEISKMERAYGLPPGQIGIIAMIESARGLLNVAQIASASERLQALIFGAEDYAADVGATRTRQGTEVLYARSAIVAAAAAFGLEAIDLLFVDFRDLQGLAEEAKRGAELGYSGMQVIHPNQIKPVQDAFTPPDAAIEQALHVVKANADHQASGTGAFALDGKMVDMPAVKAAERVLMRARAAGKRT